MKFSIVVPSLNQAPFLGACLDSLLIQKEVDLEIIVRDGGSSDSSVEILRGYGNRIVWTSEPDGGQSAAINAGMRQVSGDLMGYLNSDDVLLPGALKKVQQSFEKKPDLDLVYGDAHHIDENGQVIGEYRTLPWGASQLGAQCIICQPAAFWTRTLWQRVGEFDCRLHCSFDYDYWIRMFRSGAKVAHVEKILAGSRDYESTKTRSQRGLIYREIIQLQRHHLGRAHAQWFYEYLCYLKWEHGGRLSGTIPSNLNTLLMLAKFLSKLTGRSRKESKDFFSIPPQRFDQRITGVLTAEDSS